MAYTRLVLALLPKVFTLNYLMKGNNLFLYLNQRCVWQNDHNNLLVSTAHPDGRYCALPHVNEPMLAEYDELFPVINTQPEIDVLVNPFITAYQNDAMEQLEGRVA